VKVSNYRLLFFFGPPFSGHLFSVNPIVHGPYKVASCHLTFGHIIFARFIAHGALADPGKREGAIWAIPFSHIQWSIWSHSCLKQHVNVIKHSQT